MAENKETAVSSDNFLKVELRWAFIFRSTAPFISAVALPLASAQMLPVFG